VLVCTRKSWAYNIAGWNNDYSDDNGGEPAVSDQIINESEANETVINERAQLLLKTLIERYIREGQPVGSENRWRRMPGWISARLRYAM